MKKMSNWMNNLITLRKSIWTNRKKLGPARKKGKLNPWKKLKSSQLKRSSRKQEWRNLLQIIKTKLTRNDRKKKRSV
jgi:hypothetical protein